jgi:hypothetical protein
VKDLDEQEEQKMIAVIGVIGTGGGGKQQAHKKGYFYFWS